MKKEEGNTPPLLSLFYLCGPPLQCAHCRSKLDEPRADGPRVVAVPADAAPFEVAARPQHAGEQSRDAAVRVDAFSSSFAAAAAAPLVLVSKVHRGVSRLGDLLGQRERLREDDGGVVDGLEDGGGERRILRNRRRD